MTSLPQRVSVAIADPVRARQMRNAIAEAIAAATPPELPDPPVVRFRTKKKLEGLGADVFDGAIAVIRVTERNARHLESWITRARDAGAAGVQLVWDGRDASPEKRVLARVFRVMELARATLRDAPIVLASSSAPAFALLMQISQRAQHASVKGSSP